MLTKTINTRFFKIWSSEMSYILGYIIADGCITIDKKRKNNPYTLNITSVEKKHLYKIRKELSFNYKIGQKLGGNSNLAYQIQIRNHIICKDLIKLGILPRKTYNLKSINIPDKYFSDFTRGFFDGDGSVYIYKVNETPQIKAGFVSASLSFITEFNKQLCKNINIPLKNIHQQKPKTKNKVSMYSICFYIDDCEKLNKFMYKNNSSLYLPRKHQIFKKWESIKRRKYIKQNYPSKIKKIELLLAQ